MPATLDSREAPIRAALTPDVKLQTQGEQDALTLRQGMAKDSQGTPLERFNRALEASRPARIDKTQSLIDQNIGIDRDPATGKKILNNPEEAVRERSVTKSLMLARELADKGYDSLNAAQKREAVKFAGTILGLSPEIAAIVPTNPAERTAFTEDLLREKGFVSLVQEGYLRATSDSARLTDEVTPAQEQFAKAQAAEAQRVREKTRTNAELTTATERLERFEPGHADDVELARLNRALPDLTERLRDYDEQLGLASEESSRLRLQRSRVISRGEDPTNIEEAISAQNRERARISNERTTVSDEVNKRDQLERDKASLPKTVDDLTDNLTKAEAALAEATRARLSFQANLEGLRGQRAEQEQGFVDEVGDIVPEAMAKYIQQQLKAAEDAQRVKVKEISDKSTDRAMKAVANQTLTRWERPRKPTLLNRSTTETNTPLVNIDMSRIVDPARGPVAVVRDMLERDFAVDVAARKMTQAQADQMISLKMQDQAFLDNATPIVVESVLRQKLKIGSVTEAEADVIINAPWGKGMLQKASEESSVPAVNAEMEALKAAGVVNVEGMDAKQRKNLLWLILLGAIAAGAALSKAIK